GIGNAILKTETGGLTLQSTRLTPNFESNLISVPRLAEMGLETLFRKDEAVVCKSGDIAVCGKPILRVPKINGLYQYEEPGQALAAKDSVDWHSRFGHPGE